MTGTNLILLGDAPTRLKELPSESVDCCITSPPYYGLRDYGVEGQIGLEESPEAYVSKLVEVFREVRRVLKKEGTLWLNLGDSYSRDLAKGGSGPNGKHDFIPDYGNARKIMSESKGSSDGGVGRADRAPVRNGGDGLKPKDLIGIPWTVAFALRADGWYLRSDIIWHKPNCMPESCTDRPTKAHEYIFLLSKSERYFYDNEAIKEPTTGNAHKRGNGTHPKTTAPGNGIKANSSFEAACRDIVTSRNKRTVWTVPSHPFKEAHFATFPEKLIEPCILAGTSERGVCPECGKPWIRQVEKQTTRPIDYNGKNSEQDPQFSHRRMLANLRARRDAGGEHDNPFPNHRTTGWLPSCSCSPYLPPKPRPAVVLDPFFGAGTVGAVAKKLGRHYIGIELNPDYIGMAEKRIASSSSGMKLKPKRKRKPALKETCQSDLVKAFGEIA